MPAEEFSPLEELQSATAKSAFVYVIDTSSSMRWIFDEVKHTVKAAIERQCGPEDCLSIILFGDTVTTLGSYKSVTDTKKETVAKLLDSVYAESVYTNFGLALKKGTENLHKYFHDKAAEDYTLILVSDGKDHPPPRYVREYSLEEAITQFPDFLPGKQWSLRYIVFKGQTDPELLALIDKYGESFFDVEKIAHLSGMTEKEVIEGIIENPENWELLEPLILDQVGDVKIKRCYQQTWSKIRKDKPEKVFVGDRVAVAPESKALISFGPIGKVGLQENTEISLESLQKLPSKKSTAIQLKLESGTLWNVVDAPPDGSLTYEVLTPIAVTGIRGTVLRMTFDPQELRQSIAVLKGSVETTSTEDKPLYKSFTLADGTYSEVVAGRKPTPPQPLPTEILVEWARWMKALVWSNPFSHINFDTVMVRPLADEIVIGPIKPGKKFSKRLALAFSEEYYGNEAVSAKAMIDLPPGTQIKITVLDVEDNVLEKHFLVSLDCPHFLRYTGLEKYSGTITLECADPDVKFTRDHVHLQVLHSPPSLFTLGRQLSPRKRALLLAAGSLLTVFVLLVAWIKRKTLRRWRATAVGYVRDKLDKRKLVHFFRARPSGRMVLQHALAKGGQTLFDLAKISRKCDSVTVGIGADPSAPICLPHASVRPIHCVVWAGRSRNPTRMYIERSSDGHLAVNGEKIKHIQQLHDKDVIEVGECKLKFIDTQFHQQVKVRMKNNTIYKGTLHVWDLGLSFFYLSEMSGDEEDAIALHFDEVSHVHFYRDESERTIGKEPHSLHDSSIKHRKAVTVTLVNNRRLKGFVDKKYQHKESSGIFLLPSSENTDIQYTYIPHTSISAVIVVDSK
jgi:small nuclear ribonucleoprotein (snRNP)-like protein